MSSIKDHQDIQLSSFQYIEDIQFLFATNTSQKEVLNFYKEENKHHVSIQPLYIEQELIGYLKFIYQNSTLDINSIFLISEISLLILEIFILMTLYYMKNKIIHPFQRLIDLPEQIARGHLKSQIKEEKSRI